MVSNYACNISYILARKVPIRTHSNPSLVRHILDSFRQMTPIIRDTLCVIALLATEGLDGLGEQGVLAIVQYNAQFVPHTVIGL